MVIWKDINVRLRQKCIHVVMVGHNFRHRRAFINTFGEVPVLRFNEITGKFEDVVNPRGRAYAARNRLKYRNS